MKKFRYIFLVAMIAIAASSCRKTLELAPEDYFGDASFWQNESQVTNFMVGLHNQFRGYQYQFVRLGELRGGGFSNIDRQNTSLNELPIIEQRIEETSPGVSGWGGFYGEILQTNIFIQQVEAIGFLAEDKKNYLLGQAYALRAFYYFHLLRTYGGVPLVLEPTVKSSTDPVVLRTPRSTEAEVLTAIKADVNKSITLFETAGTPTDKSQWSPQAALMLKGEVYLWSAKVYNATADLAEAKNALNAVTGPALQENFADAFAYSKKNNNEIIFAIRYRVGEAEMGNYSTFLYSTFNFDGQHYKDSSGSGTTLVDPLNIAASNVMQIIQRYGYTFELFQSYDIADKRRNATFYDYYKVDKSTTPVTVTVRNTALVKFLGTIDANKRYFADDWPVYREADRLLMLAEITNAEGGDPTQYIKAIRDRAFVNADPTPFVNGSKDENELAIFAERSKEFVYEGKRWYDLRRMKYGNDPLVFMSPNHPYGVLDKNNTDQNYKTLWPIDVNVWTNDPAVDQTPGYTTSKPK